MMNDDELRSGFDTTQWSLIRAAATEPEGGDRESLTRLLECYLPPLRAHLVCRMRLTRHDANDILQEFVARKLLRDRILLKADSGRGRFRSFLLTSLRNYVLDDWKRRRPGPLPAHFDLPAQSAAADPFDVEWARAVVHKALRKMQRECEVQGLTRNWRVFQERLVGPISTGRPAPSYASLAPRLGFDSESQAANALITAKRQFCRALAAIIRDHESVSAPEDVAEIIDEVCRILQATGSSAPWRDWVEAGRSGEVPREQTGDYPALDDTAPDSLARLMRLDSYGDPTWSPQELKRLLEETLARPLVDFLAEELDAVQFFTDHPHPRLNSHSLLGDLFQDEDPPVALLSAAKRQARQAVKRTAGAGAEVSSVLYFASIAAALVMRGERISKSSDEMLRNGLSTLQEEVWPPEGLRRLFRAAQRRVS